MCSTRRCARCACTILFREALQRRLQLDRPDDWRALMQRAAALEGDTLRKQAMLLAASCFEEAARALLRDGTELNISGAAPTTLRLVDAFPPEFIAGSAELQRVLGIGKISVWRFQEAERHFVQAEALYAARGDTGAVQSMTARRAQATLALGRLQECAAHRRIAAARAADRSRSAADHRHGDDVAAPGARRKPRRCASVRKARAAAAIVQDGRRVEHHSAATPDGVPRDGRADAAVGHRRTRGDRRLARFRCERWRRSRSRGVRCGSANCSRLPICTQPPSLIHSGRATK